ncbi:hypothetical protein BV20DRAFT_973721 [Pilatotrama ljubarskyi]|nr:hypothetical protein BV20DRAFT_973721 [Pilatotrama ljubarskyi]
MQPHIELPGHSNIKQLLEQYVQSPIRPARYHLVAGSVASGDISTSDDVEASGSLAIPRLASGPPVPSQRFRVPLPPKMDPDYCEPITIRGVPGLCCQEPGPPIRNVKKCNVYIVTNVDRFDTLLDGLFPEEEVYIHKGVFACHRVEPRFYLKTLKDPQKGFNFGHLLRRMVDKQFRSWFCKDFLDRQRAKDLQDLVGPALAPERGVHVTWDMVYFVAVRRWMDRRGRYHYFPEIEIRI